MENFKTHCPKFQNQNFFYHTKNIPCFLKPMKEVDRKMAEKTCTAITKSIRSILWRCFSMDSQSGIERIQTENKSGSD